MPARLQVQRAEKMHAHEAEIDADGTFVISHEVDFGQWTFGTVIQHFDGSPDHSSVSTTGNELQDPTDPAEVRRVAAELLNAADWLESVQDATT